jgi:hypothetical protein
MGPRLRFKKFERAVHPYSGLDPESWKRFLVNLHSFEKLASSDLDDAATALYSACENIRDLALGIRRADDAHHQEDLDAIANELGYEGEFIINKNAIDQGLHFFPKYLNESLIDYPENEPAFTPTTVKSHGQ